MEMIENVLVLERGKWSSDQIKVHQIAQREDIRLFPADPKVIETSWEEVLTKNSKAFAGPTVRLVGRHRLEDKLVLEVIPSDYREGSTLLGWLGVAMVPVTNDGYIALQKPVSSVSTTIGAGIRVPGCTPKDTNVNSCIIEEMREEFGIGVTEDDLTILGLIEVRPPLAKFHNALVAEVKLSLSHQELAHYWEEAEDKWEGGLHFLKLDYQKKKIFSQGIDSLEMINRQSLLILGLIIENQFDINLVTYWPELRGI